MFSSCLENIEPEGIADLRGAKAELLRAETALVEAKAARENAEAAIALAKAKVEEAIAKQEEAKAAYEAAVARLWELEAEKKEAMNAIELEQAMAEAKAAIALAEKQAAVYAAELERALQQIQTDVVKAQIEYEKALKNLAVAKVALTKKQENYLKPFVLALTTAENNVDDATVAFEEASEALTKALETIEMNKEYFVRWGERGVAKAEAALEGALEAVEIAEAALKIDSTVVDWVAMRAELEAEKKAIEDKGMASYVDGEYAELYDALYDDEEGLVTKAEEYTDYTGMTFDEETGKFVEPVFPVEPSSNTAMEYPAVHVAAPVDAEGNPVGEDFELDGYTTPEEDTPSTTADEEDDTPMMYYGDASAVLAVFDDAIENFEKLTSTKWNDYQKMVLEAKLKTVEEDEDNVADFEEYEDAVAAYKAGDVAAYKAKYFTPADADDVYDVDAAVKEYNDALDAFVTALKNWNDLQKKYAESTELPEAVQTAIATHTAETNAAAAKYYAARQKAYDDYNAARKAFNTAYYAYDRAETSYNAVISAAVNAVTSADVVGTYVLAVTESTPVEELVAAIETAIETYETASEAEDFEDEDGKYEAAYDVYVDQLAEIEDAQGKFNSDAVDDDATDKWTKAKEAYAKAGGNPATTTPSSSADHEAAADRSGAYKTAIDEADATWGADKDAADKKLAETYEDNGYYKDGDNWVSANGSFTGIDGENKNYMQGLYTKAAGALNEAITAVKGYAVNDAENIEVVMGEEGFTQFGGDADWAVDNANPEYPTYPDYLVDVEKKAFKKIEKKDLFDVEYFKETEVRKLADVVSAFATVDYDGGTYYVVAGKPADYPMSLPTYEAIVEEIAAIEGGAAQMPNYALAAARYELAEAGIITEWVANEAFFNSPLVEAANIKYEMAQNEAARANTAVAADHIKVLEAAKAEFEAYVVEAEKAVDAIRTEVEAAWAEVYPKYAELEEARETAMARYAEVGKTITRITNAINLYVYNNYPVDDEETAPAADDESTTPAPEPKTIEELVEALQAVYDDAVKDAELAELKVEYAKKRLQDIKDDKVSFVEEAQKDFDEAEAALEEAMAELAEAAAALEAAMKAVGADQVPVAPGSLETPETPAE